MVRSFYESGIKHLNGHLLYALPEGEYTAATAWLERQGILALIAEAVSTWQQDGDESSTPFSTRSSRASSKPGRTTGLETYGEAVADLLEFREREGESLDMSAADWRKFAARRPLRPAEGAELGPTRAGTASGPRPPRATTSCAAASRTRSPNRLPQRRSPTSCGWRPRPPISDAKQFADAIHAVYPDKMLAYNLSPSFNWDTTGMSDDEMRRFPEEIGKMGFVFNFMTYGGHQIDGVAAEEFAGALKQDGMLSLARLQRKMRLVESPYRTPQTLVGGPRSDAAGRVLGPDGDHQVHGRRATQHQHLVQTEVPKKLLEEWLAMWSEHYQLGEKLRVQFRPLRAGRRSARARHLRRDGDEKLPTCSSIPSRTATAAASSRCAIRTRSQSSCGRSG